MKKDTKGLNDELRELSPFLQQMKQRDTGFHTPPEYFNNVESEVFQKIEASGALRKTPAAAPLHGFRFWIQPKVIMAAAAVVITVLAAWWFVRPSQNPGVDQNYEALAAALTSEDAEAYILTNLQEFETGTLEQYASAEPASHNDNTAPNPAESNSPTQKNTIDELSNEQLDLLLDDMSDEELEEIL